MGNRHQFAGYRAQAREFSCGPETPIMSKASSLCAGLASVHGW